MREGPVGRQWPPEASERCEARACSPGLCVTWLASSQGSPILTILTILSLLSMLNLVGPPPKEALKVFERFLDLLHGVEQPQQRQHVVPRERRLHLQLC